MCVVVSVTYLTKSCIHTYCHGVSVFKNLNIKVVMHKTEGLVKRPIVYLIHIKILSCHIESILFRHHLTWQCQKCVNIHNKSMHYHIGNMFWFVVCNVHGLIFQVQNQIRKIKMLSLPYNLMSIKILHGVLCMADAL